MILSPTTLRRISLHPANRLWYDERYAKKPVVYQVLFLYLQFWKVDLCVRNNNSHSETGPPERVGFVNFQEKEMEQKRDERDCPKHGKMINFRFVRETTLGFIRNYWCPYCRHEADVEIQTRTEPIVGHHANQ